ncbi:hypothetical protein MtrunA17_Chr8g0339671 [Medicago truncatula]|uniref:Uncharacterized protein n=1 Tax=Medicago truncatula TaxID=3880 RepID=A0A396GJV9_MEDTR|nr:hypothetical protein MtrunA17_Chr8g0339671 [Medicago truncatula]
MKCSYWNIGGIGNTKTQIHLKQMGFSNLLYRDSLGLTFIRIDMD